VPRGLTVKYAVTGGTLKVSARSRIHDTTTTWNKLAGTVEADPDTLATAGAKAVFTVEMTSFDAGDFLKNRKLRKDFEMEAHPKAEFELTKISDVLRDGPTFTATAEGTLRWRGKHVPLVLAGQGKLDAMGLEASATFELDIRKLGLSAPRFLMFKMEDEVTVAVTIRGAVQP
jgi:polyisoprenoid-binding protein YceI